MMGIIALLGAGERYFALYSCIIRSKRREGKKMPQQMMWNTIEDKYKGQASDGTLITVDEDVMMEAHKRAGKAVYDTDWWTETLVYVLASWGIFGERSYDHSTRLPTARFRSGEPRLSNNTGGLKNTTGPLSARLTSGPISTRNLPRDPHGNRRK
jgi:hypothetical protein